MRFIILIFFLSVHVTSLAQSIARKWNEALMSAIRIDKARPTVQARNLYHVSAAMYDAWAAYDDIAMPSMITRPEIPKPADIVAARNEAISYAAFRMLLHRFANSPGKDVTIARCKLLMSQLGYNESFTSTDYSSGSPAALGNYIASRIIQLGIADGSNELADYTNLFYQPVNQPLRPALPGIPGMVDCNRWQPLELVLFCDQAGNPSGTGPPFLSPEWGIVKPFALSNDDVKVYTKGVDQYWVYHDPGPPPLLDSVNGAGLSKEFMWNFSLVSIWSSHLDQRDQVMIDISPASQGNIALSDYPTTIEGLRNFYDVANGGDIGKGYSINPKTGQPYQPQVVPRGDYTRVLAEFWADGPNSETPPGHWFTILNYVNDHPLASKKFGGKGEKLDDLEWDVKAYLTMGGALHDVAITAWGIKGYYDGVRPISAIRYMAKKGQSTSSLLPNYHPAGIPLQEGFIELVKPGDPLAGVNNENVNKIKLYSWRGSKWIQDPGNPCGLKLDTSVEQAGVGWILAETWVPYQRPTFVTPPFAGYISGHSTYSSAAAEVLTLLTGDEYFPGGMAEFPAKKNAYLVFEVGPSVDITLQWARYKDASDQSSLSRIWGGIHPPSDDIPGRLIGKTVGTSAFAKAEQYFQGITTGVEELTVLSTPVSVYPNPVSGNGQLFIDLMRPNVNFQFEIADILGRVQLNGQQTTDESSHASISLGSVPPGSYIIKLRTTSQLTSGMIMVK